MGADRDSALHRQPLLIVLDAANIVGSRADGWWNDRVGATERLRDEITALSRRGIAAEELPGGLGEGPGAHWYPRFILVVEGKARAVRAAGADVEVVSAAGSADDTIEELVRATRGALILVVTADRELRRRCTAAGATVVGPRWLLNLLPLREGRSGDPDQGSGNC